MSQTVDDLLQQVREQLDEFNTDTADDDQILNALNRGHRKAINITSRRLDEILLATTDITSTPTDTYNLPVDIFARKVHSIQIQRGSTFWDLEKIDQKISTPFISSATVSVPSFYYIVGNTFRVLPQPKSGITIRVWYLQKPEKFVKEQGRISSITSGSNFINVDDVGSDLTTVTDGFNAYVNFVDFVNGSIKGTMQISSIDSSAKKITFKSAGLTRSTVLNRTILTAIPSTASVDDFICTVQGTAVSQLPEAYVDFTIQYAVFEVKRRFGEPSAEEIQAMQFLEKELRSMWAGRENKMKVRKTSSKWSPFGTNLIRRFVGDSN